ncbi:class I SAM-dependent methyltransferase [Xylophilus sp.]|uniref:class I SAM-dependent methyltransferase n=1 Tax=Xylophilus sp. TaxID=2653893 RepID=UPI0013BBA7AC|nr:methyltransferase domain-containing protein [Xylophilus sp.]KAF1047180.1 MAG: hypothetical protein GAK38_02061 [Xylophilus sp.]
MSAEIIGLHPWFDTPSGRHLLAWEQDRFDEAVADIFGYHGLQLGLPGCQALRANRMPHRWLAVEDPAAVAAAGAQLAIDFAALPFGPASLDLVVLPHTLEFSADPHTTLREVERVLVPEGKVVISGINPASLWGPRERRARLWRRLGAPAQPYLPQSGGSIGYWRLRDWLGLLSFEVESARFGCYAPAVRSARWIERFGWMEGLGSRSWPIFGAGYFIVATKRVQGLRLMEPGWKTAAAAALAPAAVPAVNRGRRETLTQRTPCGR